jgi:hypothetical protein
MRVRKISLALVLAFVLLVAAAPAQASEPRWTQAPSIVQEGSRLVGSNGGWLSESGTPSKFVFRFSRNGVTVQGPDGVPKSTQASDPLPAGVYPDNPNAHVYELQPADAGQQMCVEVWGGIHSAYQYADGTYAYNVWEWGHVNVHGQEAKACLTASGSAPAAPATPSAPAAPAAPAVPAPQAPLAPVATAAPGISGLAMVEETLTATRGSWTGSPSLALQWMRCDAQGQNCADLGLSGDTYTLIGVDVGKTLRIRITALNSAGVREAVSDATAVVTELKPTEQKPSLAAAKVIAPHRLVVGEVVAKPAKLSRLGKVTLTLRVSDSRGFRISGALVSAVVLPSVALVAPVEATTDENGLVKLTFAPGSKLYVRKPRPITLVVTARRPGDRKTSPRAAVVRVTVAIAPKKKR